jgi:hypothetical protein
MGLKKKRPLMKHINDTEKDISGNNFSKVWTLKKSNSTRLEATQMTFLWRLLGSKKINVLIILCNNDW